MSDVINAPAKTINPFWESVKPFYGPKEWSEGFELARESWALQRDHCCRLYAWAVPDPASLAFVLQHLGPRAIEIGAGVGYWAWQLEQLSLIEQIKGHWRADFDILCYDAAPPDKVPNFYFCPREEARDPKTLVTTWHPVLQGTPEILKEHPDRTLFLCWPPYAESMAAECLQHYQGHRLVFIGEDKGGCTGDDAFFEHLEAEWNAVDGHSIVSWWGIHDTIMVYERARK